MNIDEAIQKAQKLLRLSHSDNVNESAAALRAAQEILTRYEITQSMLAADQGEEDEEEIEDFAKKGAPLDEDSPFNLQSWRERLAGAISRANSCRIYISSTHSKKTIEIVGRPSDVDKVRYLFQYFKNETERLCNRDGKGCGTTWRNNYRHGVVDTLSEALDAARKSVEQNLLEEARATNSSTALVRVETAIAKFENKTKEVDDWLEENLKLKSGRSTPMAYNNFARQQGQIAGKEIKLTQARGALKS